MYICICKGITDKQIKEEVKAGAATLRDLQETLGVASCCGGCAEMACAYLPNISPTITPCCIPTFTTDYADNDSVGA